MSEFEKKRLDDEFMSFVKRNFEKPRKCQNLEQLRFYISELSVKVDDLKNRFNYVPDPAYRMLSQYNAILNRMVYMNFKNTY